jgi:hypothetical protein
VERNLEHAYLGGKENANDMAVDVRADVDDNTPSHGDTITFTYTVSGNDAIDPAQDTITGVVTIGGQDYVCSTTLTLPGTPAASESFAQPTSGSGSLSFVSTPDPAVFTAVVP